MDQDATWYEGMPPTRRHCVRRGPSSQRNGTQQPPPHFHNLRTQAASVQACFRINRGPCLLWPKSWMDQDATWYQGRPRPTRHCVGWGPSSPVERGTGVNGR